MGAIKQSYLFLYNASLTIAWGYILYLTAVTLYNGGELPDVWRATQLPLKVAQTTAIMEVLHAATGIVRSPVVITATQVASRLWILWGILNAVPSATTTQYFPPHGPTWMLGHYSGLSIITLITAWSLSEIIRYGLFACKAIGAQPYPLLWLRYSAFTVLYPLGVLSELAMVALALPVLIQTGKWSVTMPNPFNFSFSYWMVCVVGVALYLPGFPKLYTYMLTQREKILGGEPAAKPKAE